MSRITITISGEGFDPITTTRELELAVAAGFRHEFDDLPRPLTEDAVAGVVRNVLAESGGDVCALVADSVLLAMDNAADDMHDMFGPDGDDLVCAAVAAVLAEYMPLRGTGA